MKSLLFDFSAQNKAGRKHGREINILQWRPEKEPARGRVTQQESTGSSAPGSACISFKSTIAS